LQILDFEEHTFYLPGIVYVPGDVGCGFGRYVGVGVVLKAITDPGQPYAARTLDRTGFNVCM
jgi:hypothetical protein